MLCDKIPQHKICIWKNSLFASLFSYKRVVLLCLCCQTSPFSNAQNWQQSGEAIRVACNDKQCYLFTDQFKTQIKTLHPRNNMKDKS